MTGTRDWTRYDTRMVDWSPGGASLQACALVLIFAACVEAQRPTCHACGLWHDDATPCEVHAPGIGELLERATAMGDMSEPKYVTAAGLRVRADDTAEPRRARSSSATGRSEAK